MKSSDDSNLQPIRVIVFGVGAFAHSVSQILKEHGAEVCSYLIRDYGHYGPSLVSQVYPKHQQPNPCPILHRKNVNLVVPMSIDWILADWADELLATGKPIFSPKGDGMLLERDRDFAHRLCRESGIPYPRSYVAQNRLQADDILKRHPGAYVIKNTLCSPLSPVHTIVCESPEDTHLWLDRVDYAEGVFLQEYMGRKEAGHIAIVSGGEIHSLVTNQEYKRAFDGNMGVVAGAPLGGLVEQDPADKYNLATELLHPLFPWFRKVNFHGPVQVTAARRDDKWVVLEYNVRIGVTSGPMILRMLENPLEVLLGVARNQSVEPRFKKHLKFGCSLSLAGYGYPYSKVEGPKLPVQVKAEVDCDLWWNEVAVDAKGQTYVQGQRIADVAALAPTLEEAIGKAYANIRKINCLSSYYRTDIGRSLWPPGAE